MLADLLLLRWKWLRPNCWEKQYALENSNYDDHGDEGENWFGEDSMRRVVNWCLKNQTFVPKDASILDLGCGNGLMSIELSTEGYTSVVGVDYCEAAIVLSTKLAKAQDLDNVKFLVCDITAQGNELKQMEDQYNVCIDKGTYDAISLNPTGPKEFRSAYIENVYRLLKDDGILIITSCNWTGPELESHFRQHFDQIHMIPTPQMKFGGQVGSTVTSLVFKKKNDILQNNQS